MEKGKCGGYHPVRDEAAKGQGHSGFMMQRPSLGDDGGERTELRLLGEGEGDEALRAGGGGDIGDLAEAGELGRNDGEEAGGLGGAGGCGLSQSGRDGAWAVRGAGHLGRVYGLVEVDGRAGDGMAGGVGDLEDDGREGGRRGDGLACSADDGDAEGGGIDGDGGEGGAERWRTSRPGAGLGGCLCAGGERAERGGGLRDALRIGWSGCGREGEAGGTGPVDFDVGRGRGVLNDADLRGPEDGGVGGDVLDRLQGGDAAGDGGEGGSLRGADGGGLEGDGAKGGGRDGGGGEAGGVGEEGAGRGEAAGEPDAGGGPVQVKVTGRPATGVTPSPSRTRTAKEAGVPTGSVPEGAATSIMRSGTTEFE